MRRRLAPLPPSNPRPRRSRGSVLALAAALLATAAPGWAAPARAPKPVTGALPVSECPTCHGPTPRLAGSTGADLMALWDAHGVNGGDFRVYRRIVDANGNVSAEIQVSPGTSAGATAVAGDGAGWVLGFFNPGRVFVQRLDPAGTAMGDPLLVNEPSEGDSHGSALAVRGNRMVATFDVRRADGGADMVSQMLDGSLNRVGPRVILGPAHYRVRSRACIRPDGSAVIAWNAFVASLPGFAVRVRLQGADSAPLGDMVELASGFGESPVATVACGADGSFAVAWATDQRPHARNGWDPVWQWFDAAGLPRGPVTALNARSLGDQRKPELLVLSDGSLLAIWESLEKKATTLRARRFAANGKPRGGELVLHRAPRGSRLLPEATLLPGTGRFAVSWQEAGRGWVRIFRE